MPAEDLSDDYVANLLKQDAKTSSLRYARIGLGALLPKRPTGQAPKPNIRFLRNIIRETDSHNTALLAKEAEDSRAKLAELRKANLRHEERSSSKRHATDNEERKRTKRRRHSSEDSDSEGHERRRDRKRSSRRDRSRSSRDREGRRNGDRHRSRRKERERSRSPSHKRRRSRESRRERDDRKSRKSRRSRSRSSSPSDSSSRSRTRRHKRSRRHHSDSPPRRKERDIEGTRESTVTVGRPDDSDPLEDLVGPLPPKPVSIKRRGRGAFTVAGAASMDAHFAADYDPSVDVRPASDEDDWEQALEVYRDRQKMRQSGADRLRQAGFTEDEITKWQKGGEKTEEDVKWAKKGEGREWDRGKVVDEDGDIELQAEWGRLKGTGVITDMI